MFYRSVTEWERQRERDEFTRAAILYRPLNSMFANRFTPATSTDPQNVSKKPLHGDGQKVPSLPNLDDENETPADMKAAQMGMFGKLTRTLLEWHPEKLLCKRFNIPDPYPGSRARGVPAREKKSKSSSYFEREFLSIESSKSKNDNNQFLDDCENEDDFTSKLNAKNTCKKGLKIGPLSHLNDQLNADLSDKGAESILPTVAPVSATVSSQPVTKTEAKPSIDIFKAIFDNSDDSSDSSSEEELSQTESSIVDKSITQDEKTEISIESFENDISKTTDSLLHQDVKERNVYRPKNEGPLAFLNVRSENSPCTDRETNRASENATDDYSNRSTVRLKEKELIKDREKTCYKVNDKFSRVDSSEDSHHLSIKYTNRNGNATKISEKRLDRKTSGTEDEWSEKTERKKSKKKKRHYDISKDRSRRPDSESESDNVEISKRKSKKHKKDKKHHKKKSKKRKTEKYRDTKSSDSDSSSEDGNKESLVPSNAVLLAKLKQYKESTGKTRPSAADFM